ncbi:MAG: YkgJ family cysteine cluster protein [Spirochaetaceae bacterium]
MSVPFYSEGLRFSCRRCGGCCRYEPGFVFLSKNDLSRLSSALSMKEEDFIRRYCRFVTIGGKKRLSLQEKRNYDCIFWENGGCSVYEARPFQCRSFPFWANILECRENWESQRKSCPGIGEGKLFTREEIDRLLYLKNREEYDFASVKED